MIQYTINGEFKTQSNLKITLSSIPQKEENTIFIGERTSKGIVICSGVVVHAQSMPKMELELSSP